MSSVHDADDIGPDDTMDLSGGHRLVGVKARINLIIPVASEDLRALEALAAERGENPVATAASLLSETLRARPA